MIEIGTLSDGKVLPVTASGKVTKEDYEKAIPELEKLLAEHGSLRFFVKLENVSGFELGALWEDLKFDRKYMNQFGKTAVVGEKTREEWLTRVSGLFFSPKVKFFHADRENEAWSWVKS